MALSATRRSLGHRERRGTYLLGLGLVLLLVLRLSLGLVALLGLHEWECMESVGLGGTEARAASARCDRVPFARRQVDTAIVCLQVAGSTERVGGEMKSGS